LLPPNLFLHACFRGLEAPILLHLFLTHYCHDTGVTSAAARHQLDTHFPTSRTYQSRTMACSAISTFPVFLFFFPLPMDVAVRRFWRRRQLSGQQQIEKAWANQAASLSFFFTRPLTGQHVRRVTLSRTPISMPAANNIGNTSNNLFLLSPLPF